MASDGNQPNGPDRAAIDRANDEELRANMQSFKADTRTWRPKNTQLAYESKQKEFTLCMLARNSSSFARSIAARSGPFGWLPSDAMLKCWWVPISTQDKRVNGDAKTRPRDSLLKRGVGRTTDDRSSE
ncbi:uncharacterized protein N7515_000725 [Penicillium bovifimosum]|uniref:Uncharacterized protein n=1 Tax=Penicillium bovifimosum TaxID=126998 RepID=A0A9W9HG50_9EURO|nr:uncharacterized protein N7515_000725 [Penicillium bovifimosum]KAJ5146161.1 hypothetical protein N7515_000725 [Penicillium bovifimosum]